MTRTLLLFTLVGLVFAGCKESAETSAPTAKKTEGQAEAPEKKAPAADPHAGHAPAQPAPAPTEASVDFFWPQAGSKVFATSTFSFLAHNMTVTPAGEHVEDKTRGHHHLIIDGDAIPEGTVVPMDEKHLHYGQAQTAAEVKLEPGKRKLTMQLADGAHISFGPKLAKTIDVEVVPDPEQPPRVFFAEPADGARVKSPFVVKFGLEGMTIRPAGEDALDKTTGHHHLIINGKPGDLGTVVPADDTHIHYGKGQTEAEISLPAGKHTLTMQFADGAHRSYGPALSATITVEVEE